MKSWIAAIALCTLAVPGATIFAQGVFMTQGEHGPVYSDKPQSGAKEVTLRPLTVLDSPKESSATPSKEHNPRYANTAYRSLVILSPENDGSVIINTGAIDVRVAAEPSLQLGEGHAFALSINGRDLGQRYTSTEFTVPPEFWGGNPPINQSAQLDASIVDSSGRVLIRAVPVRVFLRFTTVLNNPNRRQAFPIFTPIAPIAPATAQKPAVEKSGTFRAPAGKAEK